MDVILQNYVKKIRGYIDTRYFLFDILYKYDYLSNEPILDENTHELFDSIVLQNNYLKDYFMVAIKCPSCGKVTGYGHYKLIKNDMTYTISTGLEHDIINHIDKVSNDEQNKLIRFFELTSETDCSYEMEDIEYYSPFLYGPVRSICNKPYFYGDYIVLTMKNDEDLLPLTILGYYHNQAYSGSGEYIFELKRKSIVKLNTLEYNNFISYKQQIKKNKLFNSYFTIKNIFLGIVCAYVMYKIIS